MAPGAGGSRTEILIALILMGGWCGLRTTPFRTRVRLRREDRGMTSCPAVSGNGYGICGKLLRIFQQIPQPRRRRDEVNNAYLDRAGSQLPFPAEHYPLDTSLLMGGSSRKASPERRVIQNRIRSPNLGARCIIEKKALEHQPTETRRGLNNKPTLARRESLRHCGSAGCIGNHRAVAVA